MDCSPRQPMYFFSIDSPMNDRGGGGGGCTPHGKGIINLINRAPLTRVNGRLVGQQDHMDMGGPHFEPKAALFTGRSDG